VLKGFHNPLTPKGKSTLNPLPPWHYSADFLNIEFWADPAVIAATLPAGLDPDLSAKGHANALFYDWHFSGSKRAEEIPRMRRARASSSGVPFAIRRKLPATIALSYLIASSFRTPRLDQSDRDC